MNKAEEFKDFAINFFDKTKKTGWGKNEVARQLAGLWAEFLKMHLPKEEKVVMETSRESTTSIDKLVKELEEDGNNKQS